MNTKTRLTALLITLAMIVAMFPIMTLSAAATTTKVAEVTLADGTTTQYETFKDAWAVAAATTGATIKLLANCESCNYNAIGDTQQNRGAAYEYPHGTLTLDLNGFVLTPATTKADGTATDTARVLYVKCLATLIIKDSNPTAEHWYNKSETLYTLADGVDRTSNPENYIMIPGGVIYGGNGASTDSSGGGAVRVQGGRLIVEGGNMIGNNDTTGHGGAIKVEQVDFNSIKDTDILNQYDVTDAAKTNASPALVISGGTFVGNQSTTAKNNTIGGKYLNFHVGNNKEGNFRRWAQSAITGGVFADNLSGFSEHGKQYVLENTGHQIVQNETTGWYEIKQNYDLVIRGVQRSVNTTGNTYSLRLIAEVSKAAITDNETIAAFDVTVGGTVEREGTTNNFYTVGGVTKNLSVNKYYTKLLAQSDDGTMEAILPRQEGYVLIAIVIDNIPTDATIEMTVGAYITTGSTTTLAKTWALIQIVNGGMPTVGKGTKPAA